MMDKKRAIVLVSGGLDSCVTAAIAATDYELAFLHVCYHQRTMERERQAFNDIADYYHVPHRLVVDIEYLRQIGGSSLTDPSLEIEPADLEREGIPDTYVPFRNGNLLSIAASWAERIEASYIFIGAVYEDASGYPDCRPEFYKAMNEAIHEGTKPDHKLEIITPLIHLKKKEIVSEGFRLNAPLHLTWSCYQRSDQACGQCDSCAYRLRGFAEAHREDPIPYDQGA